MFCMTGHEAVHILSNIHKALREQNGHLLLVEILLQPNSSHFVHMQLPAQTVVIQGLRKR
jgi:hypothetical protein